jgi:hypothetical protein
MRPQSTTDSVGDRSKWLKTGLILAVLVCIPVEWAGEHKIYTQKIFNPQHSELTENFKIFTAALGSEVLRECASGQIRRVYFDDLDVAFPYILNTADGNSECQPVRELPITLISPEEAAQCSATIVQEAHLGWWGPGVLLTKLVPAAAPVSLIKRWRSPDGNFGFDVYRRTGCPPLTGSKSE